MKNDHLMALVNSEAYGEVEKELALASSQELYKLWQDAAYIKERTRFLLKTHHGVVLS